MVESVLNQNDHYCIVRFQGDSLSSAVRPGHASNILVGTFINFVVALCYKTDLQKKFHTKMLRSG